MDRKYSCNEEYRHSVVPSLYNGQYCLFEVRTEEDQTCLNFKGFSFDSQLMEYDTCRDYLEKFDADAKLSDYM